MAEDTNMIIDFDIYCKKCEYKDREETQIPCIYCLEEPVNVNSHKPTKFKEKEIK